ncbi:MAG: RluA family pseudouridine synthase [Comamonas sp.]|nr:RluA family pseudouridine synthase [Comamonas sp.]
MPTTPPVAASLPTAAALPDTDSSLEAQTELRQLQVPAHLHASRLDKALAELVPEFSRSYLQQLLAQGAVQLGGQSVGKPALKVKMGDALSVEMRPTAQSQSFKPEALPLNVVYEDAHLLVINKPAGMVVHPAPGNWSGTVLNALLAHHSGAAQLLRAGIVHRLDKDTSGLMMVAKEQHTMDALVQQLAERQVLRRYLAIGQGAWHGARVQRVEQPIGRDVRHRLRMAVVALEAAGKNARTDIECWASTPQHCLVQAQLHTGRTHQIRVHMQHLGHPLLGDSTYGGQVAAGMQRQALHAWTLGLQHPVTGQELLLQALPPPDWLAAAQALGLGAGIEQAQQAMHYNRPSLQEALLAGSSPDAPN